MQLRLAYSIAIQVPFDILLLDEVLAVGDQEFQEKCFATSTGCGGGQDDRASSATTSTSVGRFCDRALLLERGEVQALGPAAEVIEAYAPTP